jgi:signal transduction histidine kinase
VNGASLRLLILAPTGRDATLAASVLGDAGVACVCCATLEEICDSLADGAGALLLAEEAVAQGRATRLHDWLAQQPSWSDLPVLILARHGADSAAVAQSMEQLGNVTVLERPTRVASLVSAARSALRARQRQYQIRDHLGARLRAEEALRDADRRKDEFLAMLAHELRNPLAPLRNSLHVLRATHRGDSTLERLSAMMDRQVTNLVRLVDDLLEVARITRGKIELRCETIEASAVARSAVETSRPLIDAARHRLELSLPAEPVLLEGDAVRLTQIISNLLNNAAKYTDPGGDIRLSVARDGNWLEITVRDNGIGIAPEMLGRVFDLFTQADRRYDRTHGGLGIGLTLVKRLVEMHGGTIAAHSDGPGRGSEFVARLPLAGPQRRAA